MKNYLLLNIFIVILYSNVTGAINDTNLSYTSSNSKSFYFQDTSTYLRSNIIANKSKYIHKELNVLLKELHLTVKSYNFSFDQKHPTQVKRITLFFEDSKTKSNKLGKLIYVPSLVIYFENSIQGNKALGIYTKSSGEWGEGERSFYGNQLVKDIAE